MIPVHVLIPYLLKVHFNWIKKLRLGLQSEVFFTSYTTTLVFFPLGHSIELA